jgi:hypothetical protein
MSYQFWPPQPVNVEKKFAVLLVIAIALRVLAWVLWNGP